MKQSEICYKVSAAWNWLMYMAGVECCMSGSPTHKLSIAVVFLKKYWKLVDIEGCTVCVLFVRFK